MTLRLKSEPVSPALLVGNCPGQLEAIVMKALARNPDERYQKAGEMAEDLRRIEDYVH
jgi:serine/threonine-protein kinase